MQISKQSWKRYAARLSSLDNRAGEEMAKWIKKYGTEDTGGLIIQAFSLVTKYGEGSAELAAQMYDALAEISGMALPPAEPAEPASYQEVSRAIGRTQSSPPLMQQVVSRMVKQTGADTTLKNALRDGAEFAWIPSGATCAFCITLASRGWQRASKKVIRTGHAEHIHANCNCTYAVRFHSGTTVAGYDPEKYLAMYEGADGDTPEDKINAMRRALDAKDREKINARKRAAYAARKKQPEGASGGWKKVTLKDSTGEESHDKMGAEKLFPINPLTGEAYAYRAIQIDDAQFGAKVGRHAQDYGMDPSDQHTRAFLREEIHRIVRDADERRYGQWRGQQYPVIFHIKGDDVVVENREGAFITLLKGGASNERVKNAGK